MKRGLAEKLIAEWHGRRTASEIAVLLKLPNGQAVRDRFHDLRNGGRLPDGPRPHFKVESRAANDAASSPVIVTDDAFAVSIDRDVELSERLAERTGLRIEFDGLLAGLERHHGKDRRRHVDDNAAAILAGFENLRRVPSPALLLNAARTLDRTMKRIGA